MSVVMDIYSLIRDLIEEAEKNKNDKIVSELISIKKQINEIDEENQELKKQLDIRNKMIYDETAVSFTLPENSSIHYCSVCYGQSGKLIPMSYVGDKLQCRICEEVWFKGIQR